MVLLQQTNCSLDASSFISLLLKQDAVLTRGQRICIEEYATLGTWTQWHYSPQVRNLNYLNRDLDKVLLITANPDAHALQPDNAVKVRMSASLRRLGISLTLWREQI